MLHFDLTDQYRHRASAVHRLDPRVKVVAATLYILACSLTPVGAWASFAALLALSLAAAGLTRLGPAFALRRSFVALPFVLAALPVPFMTPGPPAFVVPGLAWTATFPGLARFASILLRTWLAVQGAILLTAVTPFPDLLWALGALRLPRLLVATIGFMYRYLFVLADEALRMLRARASRSARLPGARRPSAAWQGRVAGTMVGSLFLRALERSERVYSAMASRGYDGQLHSLSRFRMTVTDWAALAALGLLLGGALSLSALA